VEGVAVGRTVARPHRQRVCARDHLGSQADDDPARLVGEDDEGDALERDRGLVEPEVLAEDRHLVGASFW